MANSTMNNSQSMSTWGIRSENQYSDNIVCSNYQSIKSRSFESQLIKDRSANWIKVSRNTGTVKVDIDFAKSREKAEVYKINQRNKY